ncbi:MAG: hypothetical protein AAGD28_16220 [Bacteroidota bacterium]
MLRIFIFSFVLIFLIACESDQNLEDFSPVTQFTTVDGYDFYLRGSFDGEAFELGHISKDEFNRPANDGQSSSAHPFFGTNYRRNEGPYDIVIGITESGFDEFSDIIQEGDLGWYGYEVPSNSRREAFLTNFIWKGESYLGPLGGLARLESNEFTITDVQLLPLDGTISEDFEGRLYKVTGSLKTVLDNADTREEEEIELIIDEFSGIFYDDTP